MHVSWHIPELRHPDVAALDVASVVLGTGRSSRLHLEVREKAGLVHTAEAWTYNPGSPGLFGISAVVDPTSTMRRWRPSTAKWNVWRRRGQRRRRWGRP